MQKLVNQCLRRSIILNGVQASPIAKSYLLTKKGIEVVGEEAIPISTFIDEVLNFATYPKKRLMF